MRRFQRFRDTQQDRHPFTPRAASQPPRITAGQVLLHEAHLRTIANHAFGAHYSRMLQRCGPRGFQFKTGYGQLRQLQALQGHRTVSLEVIGAPNLTAATGP
jgi:hypothetical protein